MRIYALPKGTNAAASNFEPGTSQLRIRGLIHWATTAPQVSIKIWLVEKGSSVCSLVITFEGKFQSKESSIKTSRNLNVIRRETDVTKLSSNTLGLSWHFHWLKLLSLENAFAWVQLLDIIYNLVYPFPKKIIFLSFCCDTVWYAELHACPIVIIRDLHTREKWMNCYYIS